MKITAITKYKHGELHLALRKAGWNQAELSRRSGVDKTTINRIYGLKQRPSDIVATSIQAALGDVGIYLDVLNEWAESFKGFKEARHSENTLDIPMERLIGCKEAITIPVEKPFDEKLSMVLDESIETLTSGEQSAIRGYFYENKSLEEVGKDNGLSKERIRQLTEKALKKLRNPKRLNKIKETLDI